MKPDQGRRSCEKVKADLFGDRMAFEPECVLWFCQNPRILTNYLQMCTSNSEKNIYVYFVISKDFTCVLVCQLIIIDLENNASD